MLYGCTFFSLHIIFNHHLSSYNENIEKEVPSDFFLLILSKMCHTKMWRQNGENLGNGNENKLLLMLRTLYKSGQYVIQYVVDAYLTPA